MSEQNETISDDLSTWSVDDEDQLQPEDTLISDGVADVLDRGFSPNDTDRYSRAFGTTGAEQAGYETIEQRILQEVPDPVTAYGAPENEAGDVALIGGDDPDAIPADDRVVTSLGNPLDPSDVTEVTDLTDRWRTLSTRPSASPKLWMDAYLAAYAVHAHLTLVTLDSAFAQFPGLSHANPAG